MSECGHRAVLIITITPTGTSTNVARKRVELRCGLDLGHPGLHRDEASGETWEGASGRPSTVLRHEDE
jgi:hypothetical protein